MRILDRLILGQFMRLFVISLLAVPMLFIVGNLTERLDDYIDTGLSVTEIALGQLYRSPEYVMWSLPIAGLVAGVFTIHSMTAHREIVAAKAGGVSFHRLLLPILLVGIVVTGVGLQLAEYVPVSIRISEDIIDGEEGETLHSDYRTDFVYRSENGIDLSALRLVVSQNQLTNVIATWVEGDRLMHMQSESGVWTEQDGWVFRAGLLRTIWPDGSEDFQRFEQLRLSHLIEQPEDMLTSPRGRSEMTRAELQRQARMIERSGGQPYQLLVELEQRMALPAATLVIILFGAPLATSNQRGGAAWGVGVSLASTLLYLICERISTGFGDAGLLDPFLAAWLPNFVFLLLGALLLYRVRT